MQLIESILADAANVTAIRHDLHAHPELSYEEFRTADVVAENLTRWGIPIHRGLGGTGVVGTIKGTKGTSTRA
ncbi:MAG: amidohydrolase, partial [Burkholderiaceae bacterium]